MTERGPAGSPPHEPAEARRKTAIETALTALFEEVLKVSGVDGESDFLSLGGNFSQASKIASRARRQLGVEVPAQLLFDCSRLADLAAAIAELESRSGPPARKAASPTIRRIARDRSHLPRRPDPPTIERPPEAPAEPTRLPRDRPLPVSSGQRQLWFLDRAHGAGSTTGDAGYNMALPIRCAERIDLPAVKRCLDEIVARHEILRTRLVTRDGQPWQVVDPPSSLPVPLVDLGEAELGEGSRLGLAAATALLRQRFDLERDPMLRAAVLRRGGSDLLLLVIHHVACDGWSLGVLFEELATLYPLFRDDPRAPSPLPALELHYADVAHWQDREVSGARREKALEHWRRVLADPPPALELPFDRPPGARAGRRGAERDFRLETVAPTRVEELGRAADATPFMTLLAAWGVLLFRLTREGDLATSVPVANRRHPAARPLVGFFTNLLVVRAELHGDASFDQILSQVRDVCLDAFTYQDLPFDDLVEELRPERQAGRIPFVQTGFALQDAFAVDAEHPDLAVERLPLHNGTSLLDLSLSTFTDGDRLRGTFEYRSELFDEVTIDRLARTFGVLLGELIADPSSAVERLPLLPAAERHQLIVEWNATAVPFDLGSGLHQLVEAQIRRSPDAEGARADGGGQLTYRQLGRRSDRLARRLRAAGVGAGDVVGVLVERSLELPVALLAVLRAGAACLPLDPDLPPQRLELMLEDTGAAAVLLHSRLRSRLPAACSSRLLEVDAGLGADDPSEPLPASVDPRQLAYVIYTSGSTGRPKGVRLHHRGLCHRLRWQQHAHPLTPDDRILQNLSIGFDAAIWQIFGPLTAGATIVLPRPGGHLDTAYLARLMADEGVTCADFVPSVLSQLLEEPGLTRCDALRQIVSGGEPLHPALARQVGERLPGVQLVDVYGPTETSLTISATTWTAGSNRAATVGRPITNTTAYLLDRRGRPAPLGIPGEVVAGGRGLTQGYLGRPRLSAERFVPNPFGGPGQRLYRTGDLARFRATGELQLLGRIDHQVKVRGVRMELGEIESELLRIAGVSQAAVLARDDVPGAAPGGRRLVAYVAAGRPAPTPAVLRQALSRRLPAAMVPGIYVVLDALPLLLNGKIDRAALPVPEVSSTDTPRAPRDPLERRLAEIWARVLKRETVSITDGFFDLGGHSLLAVRLIAAVREAAVREAPGAGVELADLYTAGTVADMADLLRGRQRRGRQPPRTARKPVILRAGHGRVPLFCVHAVDGSVHVYTALAQAFARDRRVYGLEAPGLEDGRSLASFEELAGHHASAILATEPSGPIHLCGWSLGGLLASEIARQLEERGHGVQLILLDTHPAAALGDGEAGGPASLRKAFVALLTGDASSECGEETEVPAELLEADEAEFPRLAVELARERHALPPGTDVEQMARRWHVVRDLLSAGRDYRARPHTCPTILIRSRGMPEELERRQVPDCRALTRGPFQTRVVAADHYRMMQPPAVTQLARTLERALR